MNFKNLNFNLSQMESLFINELGSKLFRSLQCNIIHYTIFFWNKLIIHKMNIPKTN